MIRAHEDAGVVTLDVEGPATMVESPAVHEVINDALARGLRALRIDLRDCTMMDSTFSGTLLALKRQLEPTGATLTLVSPSPKVLELLGQMGLEDFYAIEAAERLTGAWTRVAPAPSTAEKLRQLVRDAHEELARVPGTAARTFSAVVEELRKDEAKDSGGAPAASDARPPS